MIMFGGGVLPQALGGPAPARRGGGPPPAAPAGGDPPATEQLIAAGWGFASISPASIQADNGAGLTRGIIGSGQQRPASEAGRLGLAARVGMGRVTRPRLSGDEMRRRCQARRHRRSVALRQSRARDDGVRPAVRSGAGRVIGRRRRETASPQLGRAGREPHRPQMSITGWPATS